MSNETRNPDAENAQILICRSQNESASHRGDSVLTYRVVLGFEGHESFGLNVGEYKATNYDRLILEGTDDVLNRKGRIGAPKEEDDRRFYNLGVVNLVSEADMHLHLAAKSRAEDIQRQTGMSINDLTQKKR